MAFRANFVTNDPSITKLGIALRRNSDSYWYQWGTGWANLGNAPTTFSDFVTAFGANPPTGTTAGIFRGNISGSFGDAGFCDVYFYNYDTQQVLDYEQIYLENSVEVAFPSNVYHGRMQFDQTAMGEKYTFLFFHNNVLIDFLSGATPHFRVVKTDDTELIDQAIDYALDGLTEVPGALKVTIEDVAKLLGGGNTAVVEYSLEYPIGSGTRRYFYEIIGRDR